ncbi:MAG: ABC transporter ATP-binding protein [Hyphomonadaceae bacterium]|nr:ABC transporter ATP-binding protein [Clostridia bacterium]
MYVEVKNLHKRFGSFEASRDVSFGIEKGKLVGLLGPSGSGKTTILRMIAGLEQPDSGEIYIDGKKVNDVPPGKRGIGFVFQSYALFRHMTVYENIAFGLKVQKEDKQKIKHRVAEMIALIGLDGLEKRYPHQLSGGQRQRVAFARALAPNPQLLLLDEPFAAIDAKVRKELRSWLKQMIKRLGVTSIFVTHDQDEAVEVADEIIVTHQGSLEQKGTPVEIYKTPKTPFVANFIGESELIADCAQFIAYRNQPAGTKAIVRPEFLEIGKLDEPLNHSASDKGVVTDIAFRGTAWHVTVKVGEATLTGYRSLELSPLSVGEQVFVLIHRLYLLQGNETNIVENDLKTDPMPVFI